MSRSGGVRKIAAALLVICLTGSVLLLRQLDRVRSGATLREFLYISSPKLVKRLSLGYEGLLADIYWTRAVQYYGGTFHTGGGDYKLLWPLLNMTTQLDPHIFPAYEYGATFLSAQPPNGAGIPQRAIELVEFGIQHNPDIWRLYYDLGYIHYDLKDYAKASDAWERGSRVPNAHPFLKILAARAAQHGGEAETARILWSSVYDTTHDKNIRLNAIWHLRALQADQDAAELEKGVQLYRQRTGNYPQSFRDLVRTGILRGAPVDPLGNEYQLDSQGNVFIADPDNFPFVEKALPPGYVPKSVPRIPPAQ